MKRRSCLDRSAVICAVALTFALNSARASEADDAGRRLFTKDATPPCALCHTLADAGATANVGPSLDELKPDAQRVMQAVKAGIGAMPAYTQLSAEQIQALARYVARASSAAK